MKSRFAVILSQGHSRNPAKRALEAGIVSALQADHRLAVLEIAHLYDLNQNGPGAAALREIKGDVVVLSWMYPRSAHWVLDQYGIDGQAGVTELAGVEGGAGAAERDKTGLDEDGSRVIDSRPIRDRKIYCLDLRLHDQAQVYLDEVRRIVQASDSAAFSNLEGFPTSIDEKVRRRWYPVIDFSRCTNCMECVDFCLFGVYGIDDVDTILVEQPDNCRMGCPACSRVCPEHAIIFPQHKTPAIAGAADDHSGQKIDLSKLFGAAEDDDAVGAATRQRDEQLRMAGKARTSPSGTRQEPTDPLPSNDELDDLIDELDQLDL